MYITIIKNKLDNSIRYYYIENNQLYYDLLKDGKITKYKKNSIFDLYNLFSIKNKNNLLRKENDYDIYTDVNGYKHYIKNNKEDFIKFFLNNGINQVFYDTNEEDQEVLKKFKKIIKFELGALIIVSSITLFQILDKYNEAITEIKDSIVYEFKYSDCDDPIKIIKENSTISEEHKQAIIDSGIIELALTYYNSDQLKELMKYRLNGLNIQYFDEVDFYDLEIGGFYNALDPNSIYIKNGTCDDSFEHEFIHVLEIVPTDLALITESATELLSHEYFGTEVSSYQNGITILKLLISTIGPDPILEYVFVGDDTKLKEVLSSNLNVEDYERMLDLFRNYYMELSNIDYYVSLLDLTNKLYENMYGVPIEEGLKEFDFIINEYTDNLSSYTDIVDNRYYFNKDKISETDTFTFVTDEENYNDYVIDNMDVIRVDNINYYQKEISEELYEKLSYKPDIEVYFKYSDCVTNIALTGNDVLIYITDNHQNLVLSKNEAIEKGYIKYYIVCKEGDPQITEEYSLYKTMKLVTVELPFSYQNYYKEK